MNSFLVAAVIAIPFAVFLVLPARSQLTLTPMFADSDPEEALNETMTLSRVKRQYCPSNCYSTCSSNSQCQSLSSSLICIGGCCCTPNLSSTIIFRLGINKYNYVRSVSKNLLQCRKH